MRDVSRGAKPMAIASHRASTDAKFDTCEEDDAL